MNLYNFLICNIILSFVCVIFLIFRSSFGNILSVKCGYYMGLMFILPLIMPMLPKIDMPMGTSGALKAGVTDNIIIFAENKSEAVNNADFYISVNKCYPLLYIFVGGMAIKLSLIIVSGLGLRRYRQKRIYSDIFDKYRKVLNVNARLYKCNAVSSPLSFGIIKKYVIIPDRELSPKQFEIAVLHELIHHKHGDIFINYLLCVLNAVYWFNPFVYLVTKEIKLAMEMYCDCSVVGYTKNNAEYGRVILDFASQKSSSAIANFLSENGKQLKRRIKRIVEQGSGYPRSLSKFVTVFFVFITVLLSVCINAFGTVISDGQIKVPSESIALENFFGGNKGTFVLYSKNDNKYMIYNEKLAYKRVSPNSTFKIPLALNGLERGIITADENTMPWNGSKNPFPEWNREQNLDSAMKYSVNWYFQEIDNKLDKHEITDYLRQINYGNKRVYGKNNYWLEDSLEISPVEQVVFLDRLIDNEYGFKRENINAVMKAVKQSDALYGKTGTGMVNGKIKNGWFVGIAVKDNNKYIFAARLENADGLTAESITKDILDHLGLR